jgi:predicted GNAT family acetyltransferase
MQLPFVERAAELGLRFAEPIAQKIYALREPPRYPTASGSPRQVVASDGQLFADWMTAFHREAVPHDTLPSRERLADIAKEDRHLFWTVDGQAVSLAGVQRRTRSAAAIAGVYTPPEFRGRGYAGSVTAAVVDRIFAEGRAAACLYTNDDNPFSNRCYAKIGFQPVCTSRHYVRAGMP